MRGRAAVGAICCFGVLLSIMGWVSVARVEADSGAAFRSLVEETATRMQYVYANYLAEEPPRVPVNRTCVERAPWPAMTDAEIARICEREFGSRDARLRIAVWMGGRTRRSVVNATHGPSTWVWHELLGGGAWGRGEPGFTPCADFVLISDAAALAKERFVFGVDGLPKSLTQGRRAPALPLTRAWLGGRGEGPGSRPARVENATGWTQVLAGAAWMGQDCQRTSPSALRLVREEADWAFVSFFDCAAVDNERVFQRPIGAITQAAGAVAAAERAGTLPPAPPASKRRYDVAYLASITRNREGRVEAFDAARALCADSRTGECFLRLTGEFLAHEAASALSGFMYSSPEEGKWLQRWAAGAKSAISPYMRVLRDARFVLCPAGHNPESYRIYEAITAGAVPVVHDTCWVRSDLANELQCACTGGLAFLRDTGAPFPILRDWRNLHAALLPYLTDPARMDSLQRATQRWRRGFGAYYRRLIVANMLRRYRALPGAEDARVP